MRADVLLLPGLYNSGPRHWQSVWEARFPAMKRVQQAEWDAPSCDDWVARLDEEIAAAGPDVVLVAHSAACTTVAKWASAHARPVRGALLVAPSDTEARSYPPGTQGFQPVPLGRLPFPSIVAASTDDPYIAVERARVFAQAWGSQLVLVGALGHINSDSDLGVWPEGLGLLARLVGDERFGA